MSRAHALLPLLLGACVPLNEGLRETPPGDGPQVVIDWDARPLPELPLPNDLATRPDPTSPTGLRPNISVEAATTALERRTRAKINGLTGWGIYMPISVRFDAPIDLVEFMARHVDDGDQTDDAVYVIDVSPGSPTYLQAALVDVHSGRFPGDVANPRAYFPNDPSFDMPSLLFDTHDEDVNGNGVLDWGEDVDNDGYLDVPNLVPGGTDERFDLMTFYERVTNTLILRPVIPLREETTYAVVLTNRLIGENGEPVRSPWKYVNHVRQTHALAPIADALPGFGLSVDDVAYAWSFTTGRITGDLVDLRRGLDGEGPFAWLPESVPPGVTEAHRMHEIAALDNPYMLPPDPLTGILGAVGFVDDRAAALLSEGYSHAEAIVGGRFRAPFLLADKDGDGNEVDEWWDLDPMTGRIHHRDNEIAFTCILPKETPERQGPFDVAIYGHGYGSSRFETMVFGWAFVRLGVAVCMMDFPGHGAPLYGDDFEEIAGIVGGIGLLPLLDHLLDARDTDTDNNGVPDSGSHQWTADSFHTRDQVRQAVLDWMWMVRALQQCGTGTMDVGGEARVTCDWNDDGAPDIGGPNARFMIAGGSLGGIVDGVAAAVMPDVVAHVPVVPGAGLLDVSTRAPTGGAVEAMHGKVMGPLVVGRPQEDGSLVISQVVNNFMRMIDRPIATLPSAEAVAGGRVVVENLMNGEVREAWIPDGTWLPGRAWSGPAAGAFRVGIPSDALDFYQRRLVTGMPHTGPEEGVTYAVPGNDGLGDLLVVTVYDASGAKVATIDQFEQSVVALGVTYEAGSPLVALAEGLGRIRAAPDTRRLISVVAMAVEPGDPVAYAPHYLTDPFEALGGAPSNVLIVPTPGDMVVAINAGIAHARVAGYIPLFEPDARYGMSPDHWLIDRKVVHGLEEFGPYTCANDRPCLFDADDLDDGTDHFQAPSDAPLRLTIPTSAGVSGMRLPYVEATGIHGIKTPDPTLPFDMSMFVLNQMSHYLVNGGQEISDDPCMADNSCDWIPGASEAR